MRVEELGTAGPEALVPGGAFCEVGVGGRLIRVGASAASGVCLTPWHRHAGYQGLSGVPAEFIPEKNRVWKEVIKIGHLPIQLACLYEEIKTELHEG